MSAYKVTLCLHGIQRLNDIEVSINKKEREVYMDGKSEGFRGVISICT
jgi:uncharacterized protein (UPF0335 family)